MVGSELLGELLSGKPSENTADPAADRLGAGAYGVGFDFGLGAVAGDADLEVTPAVGAAGQDLAVVVRAGLVVPVRALTTRRPSNCQVSSAG